MNPQMKRVLSWKRSTDNRPTWGGEFEFLMSCIAMSVGFGNVWRFPFTAYENGGGAFLVPYIAVLVLVGRPMYYMEMILGQFSSRNNVRVWALNPGFKGVGLGQLIATGSVLSYYVYLMAITSIYILKCFSSELPWATCKEEWGDSCVPATAGNHTPKGGELSSSELYFLKEILHQYDNIDNGIGYPDWKLALALFTSWTIIFFVMVKSIKSSGKASYFMAIFPYLIIIILLIRASTLKGAGKGVMYFITPSWSAIYDPNVWYAAVTQAFFSLSVAEGPIVMFSSYNKFRHNVNRDVVVVSTVDTITSLLAGFTIFGILGNLAHSMGTDDVSKVIGSGGIGLAFISYPNAIAQFDWVPQLFGVAFFLMLFVLGLGSAVSLNSAIVTVMADRFPKAEYWHMGLVACICGFLSGIVYTTPGGQFLLTVVDKFAGTFLVLGMGICEIIGIFWFYGLENFCEDLQFMTGRRVPIYLRLCWAVITPVIMIISFLNTFIFMGPLKYANREMPSWVHVLGWGMLLIGLAQVPIFLTVAYFRNDKNWKRTFAPSAKWGPKYKMNRDEWNDYKSDVRKVEESYGNGKLKHIWYSIFGLYQKPTPVNRVNTSD